MKLTLAVVAAMLALSSAQDERKCTGTCRQGPVSGAAEKMRDMMWSRFETAQAEARALPLETRMALQDLTTTYAPCEDGKAGNFSCSNVDLLSRTPFDKLGSNITDDIAENFGPNLLFRASDIWGWTDSTTGREYAIATYRDGVSVVDVTDAKSPTPLFWIPSSGAENAWFRSVWRDVKVYKNTAYIVADGIAGHGIQVVDLERVRSVDMSADDIVLETIEEDYLYTEHGRAHNIFVNEDTGFVYSLGSDTCRGGLHISDVNQDRLKPVFVGCVADEIVNPTGRQTGYSHDAQCVVYSGPDSRYTGKEICLGFNEDNVVIYDVTDKTVGADNWITGSKIVSVAEYDGWAYTHQGWFTDDQRYMLVDDELDEVGSPTKTKTFLFDLVDLENPVFIGTSTSGEVAVDHNLYIKGKYAYMSNYRAGLRINDMTPMFKGESQLTEVGFFDSDLTPFVNAEFAGVFSSYIYFPSGNIALNDITNGLFMLKFNDPNPDTMSPTMSPETQSPTASPSVAAAEPEASSSAPVIGVAAALGLLIIGSMVYYFKVVEPREKAERVDAVNNKVDLEM